MKTIAENRTVVTKQLFYRAMAAADDYRRASLRGMGILAGLWLLLLAATLVLGMPLSMAVMELVVVGAVGLWLVVLYPRSRYRSAYRAMEQRYDGNMQRTLHFYADRVTAELGGSEKEFAYEDIVRIRTGKNVMVLTASDKTGIFFALDGFTSGDAQTVRRAVEQCMD